MIIIYLARIHHQTMRVNRGSVRDRAPTRARDRRSGGGGAYVAAEDWRGGGERRSGRWRASSTRRARRSSL
jgi:hypothetical protein